MQKHVHAELIKAWADGVKIEYKSCSGIWNVVDNPTWNYDIEYRIKPTPHKHQECIDAWNRGEAVEVYVGNEWLEMRRNKHTVPGWFEDFKYRIKPKTIKTRRWVENLIDSYRVNILNEGEWSLCFIESIGGFVRWVDEEWQEVEI